MHAFMDNVVETSKVYIAIYVLYYIIHKLPLEFVYSGGGEAGFFFQCESTAKQPQLCYML